MNSNRQRGARSGWVRRETKRIWGAFPPGERAEECLRRALEAEQQAGAGSDSFRREMRDMAMQWRDLAQLALQLAHAEPQGGGEASARREARAPAKGGSRGAAAEIVGRVPPAARRNSC